MVSNGSDMAQFMLEMLACFQGKPAAIPELTCSLITDADEVVVKKSPARGIAGLRQKRGWFVYPTEQGKGYAHGGSGMGYTSMLQLFPEEDLAVFVVANDTYFDGRGGQTAAAVLAGLEW